LSVGEKEKAANLVAVRTRSGEDLGQMKLEVFAARLADEQARMGGAV
jgi:threonyl-tRNA synthetase